jgi:magnesium transporter
MTSSSPDSTGRPPRTRRDRPNGTPSRRDTAAAASHGPDTTMAPRKPRKNHIPSLLPDVLHPIHQLRVMGRLIRRRTARPGTAPGTLVPRGPPPAEPVRVSVMEYAPDHIREAELAAAGDALPFGEPPVLTWLNIEGLHDLELIRKLGDRLSLHPLVLEDIVNAGQRPKVEDHGGYLYIVLPRLSIDAATGTVRDEQISLILGPNYVLTLQERLGDDFDPVRERIRTAGARIRGQGADYLAYSLIDAVVDHYFSILEAIGDAAERIEESVVDRPAHDTMHRLHALKREMLMVRRAVWPVRDMVNGLVRSESALVADSTRVYLRDVYDHAIRIIETVEVLRDVVGGIIDLYLSSLSNRTNEIMKTLTIMASIFIPLTFIAGVYGMNFEFMPELEWRWAYPTLLAGMLAVALGMLWMFRRRRWI